MDRRAGWWAIGAFAGLVGIAAVAAFVGARTESAARAAVAAESRAQEVARVAGDVARAEVASEDDGAAGNDAAGAVESPDARKASATAPAGAAPRAANRGAVRGRVHQSDEAVRGATVELWVEPESGGEARRRASTTTDANGGFAIAKARAGDGFLRVVRDEIPGRHDQPISIPPATRVDVDVNLPADASVRGCVLQSGVTLAGVRVELKLRPDGDHSATTYSSTFTNEAGAFAFDPIVAGEGTIVVKPPDARGAVEQTMSVSPGGSLYLEVAIPPVCAIAGRVRIAADGHALASTHVHAKLITDAHTETFSERADADGAYAIRGLLPGRYAVSVGEPKFLELPGPVHAPRSTEGLTAEERVVDVRAGETATVDFSLRPLGSLVVEVLKRDGTPAVGYEVALHTPPFSILDGLPKETTDEHGIARFGDLCSRELVAIAMAPKSPADDDERLLAMATGSLAQIPADVGVSSEPFFVAPATETRVTLRHEALFAVPVRLVGAAPPNEKTSLLVLSESTRRFVGIGGVKKGATSGVLLVPRGKYTLFTGKVSKWKKEIEIGDVPPKEIVVDLAEKPADGR
ncbi:MAG TPA: carboxypeptidase-like regulatory domain-containing protein [Planctomycetota bacterium]|nr:carboxypeptidase-like regulatory domain-containing protein [Planctomycetota bacterium]